MVCRAGGGLSRRQIFVDTIDETVQQLEPGAAFSLNLLYLNAKQWAFQYPAVRTLVQSGVPIECVTIAAGIPSPDKSAEIMSALRDAGVKYVCFKPGTKACQLLRCPRRGSDGCDRRQVAILQVLEIARLFPDVPCVLQWTGGRGGGHHSGEDMHEPILATYAALRSQPNLILVAGGCSACPPRHLSCFLHHRQWLRRCKRLAALPHRGLVASFRLPEDAIRW